MQFELLSIQKKLKKTVVFITHDINEAFKLGDRVGIMKDGKIVQIDSPEEMSTHPADSYVEDFIEGADKSQVLTVKNVMIKPRSLVKERDSLKTALRQMRSNDVSSVYCVDNDMHFLGIVLINDVIQAMQENKALKEIIISDIETTSEDIAISEIIPIASETRYPIAVLDEEKKLKGLVSKATILSSVH
jgi:glycine betaine/proline transport system ATP-binding protein